MLTALGSKYWGWLIIIIILYTLYMCCTVHELSSLCTELKGLSGTAEEKKPCILPFTLLISILLWIFDLIKSNYSSI